MDKQKICANSARSITKQLLLSGALICGSAVSLPAFAQSQNDNIQAEDEIIVVGSRRQDGRTALQTTAPVDVIGATELESSGITEVNALLANSLPSFNFPQPAVADGTDSVRPAQLRGMAPDQTLVLVNGKRRHASSLLNLNGTVGRGSNAVDLNNIPANAIKRIEVLRDGAGAQYGSDAIAGVINIVLKDGREGGQVSATYGAHVTTMDGVPGLETVGIDAAGNLAITTGADRKLTDGETLTLRGNIGLPIGDEGFFNLSGEYRDRNGTNRSDFDPREAYDRINGDLDPRELGYDRYNTRYGNAKTEDLNFFFNSEVPFSDLVTAYAFGSFGKRDGESGGFNRLPGNSRNIESIYPDGFLPLIIADVDDRALTAGLRADLGGWGTDLSVNYGRNKFAFGVANSLNVSLGPNSPTEFEAGDLINGQTVVNLDVSKLMDWGTKSVNVAFGAEYRDENYEIVAGEPNSYVDGGFGGSTGSQVFGGFQPGSEVDRGRDSIGVYAELDADMSERWNLAIAGRFEDYSDFGSNVNGKLATRFDLSEAFSLRGAVSTGFRAPSLAQQNFTSIATVFVGAVPTETGTFRPDSAVAQALGSTGLDAESAFNLSAGFVWNPNSPFNLTVDAYQIDVDDRIILTENLGSADVQAVLAAAGTQANRARFFFNGVDTRTKGVDIIATYKVDTNSLGTIDFTAGMNFNDTKITALAPAPSVLANLDLGTTDNLLFARREQLRFEKGSPKSKFTGSAVWNINDLRLTARATRFGETVDPSSNPANDETLSAKWLTDLDVNYNFNDAVSLAIGANNIFDVYPDASRDTLPSPGTFDRIFPYSSFSPFGFNGRYLYSRLSYNF